MSAVISTPVDLLEESSQLGQIILQSDVFIEYLNARDRMENDNEAQRLITEFAEAKDKYEEVQRFGKYHPDYKTISKEVRSVKREMDMHDSVADFRRAERALEELLNEVCGEVAGIVSPTIKLPGNNPYFENADSGSCGTGGGCGAGGSCGCS
ncbi:YlbF family regulator [Salibacterium aidingense]|uniref:YlbF family regulator n=1 Tax=Salibacterium aidingense TaxID=384933 RepID=UPI003BBE36C3